MLLLTMKGVQKSYMIASMNFIFFAVLNQNRWSLNRTNDKLKYSLIGNGIWWISLPRETDYLKVSGAKETRQKREDVGFILLMLMEEEIMIQKQYRQLLGDRKFSNVIG